ncbi:hypothetical protein [Burkholderia multivorans]|uniref:hypothetical protein n=1 Tax=Burkholderia multivorans TaxID=87883 RepID=UPI000D47FABC|nr:hypothetical protein [Burkholderia multivorans]MBU9403887.1 hypothetical protein [Burkholderia multivorans]MDN8051283.1 hypothetical protein [Burkholderia multivorans]PRH28926.1 hypothetical protein C6T71_05910 [Burkholderia multivorans]
MTIYNRARALIDLATDPRQRFKELSEKTGISAESWKTFWNRGTKISGEMVEALGKAWPQYAFWLTTGITDQTHGHMDAFRQDGGVPLSALPMHRERAGQLFRLEIERQDYLRERMRENPHFDEDDKLRSLEAMIRKVSRLRTEEEKTLDELENDDQKD